MLIPFLKSWLYNCARNTFPCLEILLAPNKSRVAVPFGMNRIPFNCSNAASVNFPQITSLFSTASITLSIFTPKVLGKRKFIICLAERFLNPFSLYISLKTKESFSPTLDKVSFLYISNSTELSFVFILLLFSLVGVPITVPP